jgi:hypothetical protein
MLISKAVANIIGPSIIESISTFNGLVMFIEYRDIIIETIPIGIKAIVKALCLRVLLNFQRYIIIKTNSKYM